MSWIKPVTDRTSADAAYADKHRDSASNNKGAFNYDDLNRIEGDCQYLADQVNGYGYSVSITTKTNWAMTDWPSKGNIDRIRSNIQAIEAAYFTLTGTPDMDFTTSFDWDDANDLEQNLKNINILIKQMIQGFRYSGGFNFYSGSEVVLP